MKLKTEESINYRCDKCGGYNKHKEMYDDKICYICWEKDNLGEKENENNEI